MPKLTKVQVKAMQDVCHYILDCTDADYDDYVQYCDDYGYDPAKIRGKGQSKHVYAKAYRTVNLATLRRVSLDGTSYTVV
jgi:hypothetical protein